MNHAVGAFDPDVLGCGGLRVCLHTRPQWRAAAQVSQFVSGFLDSDLRAGCSDAAEARTASAEVVYAVSELIENATKYSRPGLVELHARVCAEHVVVSLSHPVDVAHAERYRQRAGELLCDDPAELLMATVERNAASADGASGLGLLSLMSDYGARLGWYFETSAEDTGSVRVTTQAHLPLHP